MLITSNSSSQDSIYNRSIRTITEKHSPLRIKRMRIWDRAELQLQPLQIPSHITRCHLLLPILPVLTQALAGAFQAARVLQCAYNPPATSLKNEPGVRTRDSPALRLHDVSPRRSAEKKRNGGATTTHCKNPCKAKAQSAEPNAQPRGKVS
jgi:hypothetical protein